MNEHLQPFFPFPEEFYGDFPGGDDFVRYANQHAFFIFRWPEGQRPHVPENNVLFDRGQGREVPGGIGQRDFGVLKTMELTGRRPFFSPVVEKEIMQKRPADQFGKLKAKQFADPEGKPSDRQAVLINAVLMMVDIP